MAVVMGIVSCPGSVVVVVMVAVVVKVAVVVVVAVVVKGRSTGRRVSPGA
ncbi:hypothetical protein N7925_20170 [Streptomyces sp. CA-278952]|nr:hypothetical protein [Streptomyces sp. CA-278952]WDG30488.1 hypothetical protein N7925_20170 [Streptomyces sp. CA-278952]